MDMPLVGLKRRPIPVAVCLALLAASTARAANPYVVGATITNPVTGASETVQALYGDTMVLTNQGNAIYVITAQVGDTFPDPTDPNTTLTITAVHTNATTNLTDQVTVTGGRTFDFVRAVSSSVPPGSQGAPGNPGGSVTVTIPSGNSNVYANRQVGSQGSGGSDGWGLEICIIKCFTVGQDAEAGDAGGTGPTINATINGPDITSISPDLPGVTATSIGGNGGKGGNAYVSLGVDAAQGGAAGAGGQVDITSNVNISTSGDHSYGMFAQSRAGNGGSGGNGWILSNAGSGGPPAQGGNATATNNRVISTTGAGASGILVQSLGGGGGTGGDSYGIVGVAGSASAGGNAGNATAINNGTIITSGVAAHGAVAQSIGGDGGDAGTAGGLVGLGGSGNTGGSGALASVTNKADASITTHGAFSNGILAQSIGGGGGNGGTAGGLVGIGGSGAGGGNGGDVNVTNEVRSSVTTTGANSHAIVAQSIGGGGGNGGVGGGIVGIGGSSTASGDGHTVTVTNLTGSVISTSGVASDGVIAQSIGGGGGTGASSGGAFAMGGSGGAAGNGGTVSINSAASITTRGVDSKGLVGQSIGGGGGSANASGAIVSLGGKGGAGGSGGTVSVTNSGTITTGYTTGNGGADGIFAQSIGGGGGDGGSSGGLVALGGAGTSGGVGGNVTVTNHGTISTNGQRSRGVLAQSVGGGGGTGGDGGGLVSFGGAGSVASKGGVVTVTNNGTITTQSSQSSAIEAQSIGGGGGDGGTSGGVFFTLGGAAGGGGDADTVTVGNNHNLATVGNDSHGVFAQSIGGGGGNGGNSISVSAFAGAAVGGKGGAGGIGSDVTVNATNQTVVVGGVPVSVTPLIQTNGDRSKGIFAQSVGGGGGNGGFASQVSVGYSASASVAVGGSGGDGGNAGVVRVNGDSTILTHGTDSDGVLAQSVGGGGGNGGFAFSFAGAAGDAAGIALGVGVGGSGGDGGNGGDVILNSGGRIATEGRQAEGLIAQSVGGGGGNGGFSVTIAAAGSGGVAGAVSVGVGGTGGDGGDAGTVNTTYHGDVETHGSDASAVLLQAVGGGGGNGGFTVSGAVSGAGGGSFGAAIGVGGSGGGGGDGGLVTANITGDIDTERDRSNGLIAQSIGGRGGNGAFNVSGAITGSGGLSGAVSVGVGGAGGGAGNAKKVDATLTGDATTLGVDSDAVLIQSVGGGGGNGGFNVSGTITASSGAGVSASVGVGGAGGGGGNGGEVIARTTGDISTQGARSNAFIAQSLGGGGGNGGFNVSAGIAVSAGGGGAASVGVGGSGGGGGDASTVDATLNGNVSTQGTAAAAIIAQSLGGGGGNGGLNVSGSIGLAQAGSSAISVGVGGSGGGGGDGKKTTLRVTGDVTTQGSNAGAVLAQSAGGGGGNGGIDVAGAINASSGGSVGVSVGIGGAGGGGGDGGAVEAHNTGDIETLGARSSGFVAQSLGGGGGNGGLNVSGSIAASSGAAGAVSVGIGGSGGDGGNASTVDATLSGDVTTRGRHSAAVVAQSLGGGGGNGAMNVSGSISASEGGGGAISVGIGGSGGDGGNAAKTTLSVTGDVTTEEDDSVGVVAQSLGGGGGNGGLDVAGGITLSPGAAASVAVGIGGSGGGGGTAGEASATVTGDVTTSGKNSAAVTSQSIGGGGGNGGLNVSGTIAVSGSGAGTIGFGMGGAGGTGGDGVRASAVVTGNTTTDGNDSHAIIVQSLGGGGGSGGLNVTGNITAAKDGAGSLAVGVGGFGGGGGNAGEVRGTVNGVTHTTGDRSDGVLLQSVGGGGGNGGLNVSGSLSLAKNSSGSASVGVGGFGGSGGTGGNVTGTVTGAVTTDGERSLGVLAQSVGGGGGNGGLNVSGTVQLSNSGAAAGSIGIGGFGGGGGSAGTVSLTRNGLTITDGASSDAIVAQSVGGGGGNGGINVSGAIAGSNNSGAYTGTFGLGGFGGSGGRADIVTANVTGDVQANGFGSDSYVTEGGITRRVRKDGSNGVLAQSVGGSGGNGGLNVSGGIALARPSGNSNAVNIGVGGFGGSGGDAGDVSLVVNASKVNAVGDDKFAIGAQSIGGGGGNGGINVSGGVVMDGQLTVGVGGFGGAGGLGKQVSATANTDIVASGAGAVGLIAQSVGGGGGNGAINVSGGIEASRQSSKASLVFGLGGFGGAGNKSGDVIAIQKGTVHMDGAGSIGVLAQSVAGGGGNGGLNVSGNASLGKGYTAAIGIGGKGGLGADAGVVSVTSDGEILVDSRELADPNGTEVTPEAQAALGMRERGNGILAQSVGGGGGNGGINVTGVLAPTGNPVAVGLGGSGGGGGDAGAVYVVRGLNKASLLQTQGNASNGLTAQSVGGGGGNAGMNFVVEVSTSTATERKQSVITIGGAGGDPGHGDRVDVTHIGTIKTDGRQSDGILAQSIGGGGGNANINFGAGANRKTSGFDLVVGGAPGNGGNGGAVKVQHTGEVSTDGNDATAIFAQSVGGGGGNAEADDSQVSDVLTAPEVVLDVASEPKRSLNISIGREGGTGGTGGNVEVTSHGTLTTKGDRAVGIRAQSVGNAGGVSGTSSGAAANSDSEVSVQVGLEGGDGGSAGAVKVTSSGTISTSGSDAHAVHAQSVGGGGGVGGAVTSKLLQSGNSVSVGVGGTGGQGGKAGTVDVTNSAALTTAGDGAHGIHAQSIGGGGGDGGYAGITQSQVISAAAEAIKDKLKKEENDEGKTSTSLSALVGGKGGTGSKGGAVTVANSGSISTEGSKAYGINAQSIGGGGGAGGMVVSGSIAGGKSTRSLKVNLGGEGGSGGTGNDVSVTNTGIVSTKGDESVAIRAQSIGGGGGDAGLLAQLSIAPIGAESSTTQFVVNIGGKGGAGGRAGNVTVANQHDALGKGGQIVTEGASAHGIFAQSLGGGGGNGSSVISANLAGGKGSALVGVSIGGKGENGGVAGNVTVTNDASIETKGQNAAGVFAQSIGGGGGNGGLALAIDAVLATGGGTATPLVTLGGEGGSGSDAGNVTVNNSGAIVTRGASANGVIAQSIGGGGGNAGIGFGVSSGLPSTAVAAALSVTFGGKGGAGGHGGEVTLNHSGDISVFGNNSRPVVAESINGGGGHVALDFNGITSLPGGSALPGSPVGTQTKPVFVFDGGGSDTKDSNAGKVQLNSTGSFHVAGNNGAGNTAAAIGGGGGVFELNLGIVDHDTAAADRISLEGTLGGTNGQHNNGGDIDSTHDGELTTSGSNTPGLFMQSIGGGGGRASLDATSESGSLGTSSFVLGGTNGLDEAGGKIEHSQSGTISTDGAASHGALMQSIGGGGGALSYRLQQGETASSASMVKPQMATAELKAAAASASSAPVAVTLGSAGGSSLNGGAVDLGLTGNVSTTGNAAVGLVLQSVGAGGGVASVVGASDLNVTIGGSAGASGDGGDLDIANDGDVSTTGARAHGVFLQTVGGGGAAVFTDVATPHVTVSSGNTGDGGSIRFTQVGDIVTTGAEAYGVFAQSVGGGGGFVDGAFAGSAGGVGAGGALDLTLDGDVLAVGNGSKGLFLQSVGTSGGGDIHALLTTGHQIMGGLNGVGVAFDGGANNTFENRGLVMTRSAISGLAFTGGAGGDNVVNSGVVVGNVDLGAGANSFTNRAGAELYSGTTMNLGAPGNLFTNHGLLVPGGDHLAVATQLSGSFRQTAGGFAKFELDFATNVVDSVIATGTADVAGNVDVSLLNVHAITPGEHVKPLFYGAGGIHNSGLMVSAQPSVVIDYLLVFPDANTAGLRYDVDFAPRGVVGNRVSIGEYLNRVQAAGSSPALKDTITTLVLQTQLDSYSDLLTQLGTEAYAEQQASTLDKVHRFSSVMEDCGSLDVGRLLGERPGCYWARVDSGSSTRDSENGFGSSEETAHHYSTGIQYVRPKGWSYGAGLDVDDSGARALSGRWNAEGKTYQLGLLGRRAFGTTSASAVVTFGHSAHDVKRRLDVTDDATAAGKRNMRFASGVLNLTHHTSLLGLTVSPALDVGVTTLHGGSMKESGAEAQSAVLFADSQAHAWLEPSIALGWAKGLANSKLLRAYARFSALQYMTSADTRLYAGLEGAPDGVEPMRIDSDLSGAHFVGEAGVELIAFDRFTVGLSYSMERSKIRTSELGSLRMTVPLD